ncbi:uncharacterized protein LOC1271925 [Anopheles gambiae]|uniref:Uncharacterized protein n=1 Tax=Anopheles coluzzii TaxID=1518534 RepID=A0A6E8V8I5_ANOCL|nr:uncharacterized protein LOC1271925 [Anopheles gambiae]XP_040226501.2 uncharacterized protein LOC120951709 [Anopheles coluzzii]XP_040226509.2 uncharacterized protein LOC120951709 [Anopheles coluzzii]XP_040226528.2 uncharacterized protein LOC120951709 [Anopheles coluzzii]XP_049463090.1 uncharacterized protein LOC120951709 [Anopheles coluzzii]XP_061506180.1 uncharacterized protein LOC1271925 [Anopheles gambiae]XP_310782.4 uncharacterized protein LOC1271925 [Anopheles gambiae]
MKVLREKISKMAGGVQQAIVWFKAGGIVSPMLLIYVLHMLWPEFRPFSILFVIAIGFLWDRPAGQQVVAPSATAGSPLAELAAKVWALRTTRPLSMVAGSVAGCLTYTYLVCYVLPLWLSLGVAGLVVCWDRFGVPGGPLSIAPSLHDTLQQEQQEMDEFVPELTEVSRVLLQEVGEQGADTTPLADGFAAAAGGRGNSAEEDEEQYLRTLIPEATSNDFESAELSGSSSDELFCPEGPAVRKAGRAHGRPGEQQPIEFKSSHFNANSSSDSDDNMSRGLNFNDDEDDADGASRRPAAKGSSSSSSSRQQPTGEAMLMMSATSLASNVLVDTVYRRLLDAGALHQQQQPSPHHSILQSVASLGSTIQALRGQTVQEEGTDDESTDADEDSEFEMLNSEELNNL